MVHLKSSSTHIVALIWFIEVLLSLTPVITFITPSVVITVLLFLQGTNAKEPRSPLIFPVSLLECCEKSRDELGKVRWTFFK